MDPNLVVRKLHSVPIGTPSRRTSGWSGGRQRERGLHPGDVFGIDLRNHHTSLRQGFRSFLAKRRSTADWPHFLSGIWRAWGWGARMRQIISVIYGVLRVPSGGKWKGLAFVRSQQELWKPALEAMQFKTN
jgi:hypothetical protein